MTGRGTQPGRIAPTLARRATLSARARQLTPQALEGAFPVQPGREAPFCVAEGEGGTRRAGSGGSSLTLNLHPPRNATRRNLLAIYIGAFFASLGFSFVAPLMPLFTL